MVTNVLCALKVAKRRNMYNDPIWECLLTIRLQNLLQALVRKLVRQAVAHRLILLLVEHSKVVSATFLWVEVRLALMPIVPRARQ